jgi:hypothetical protein
VVDAPPPPAPLLGLEPACEVEPPDPPFSESELQLKLPKASKAATGMTTTLAALRRLNPKDERADDSTTLSLKFMSDTGC